MQTVHVRTCVNHIHTCSHKFTCCYTRQAHAHVFLHPHAGLSSGDTLQEGVSKETEMSFQMSLSHRAESFFIGGRYCKNTYMYMQSQGVSLQVIEPAAGLHTLHALCSCPYVTRSCRIFCISSSGYHNLTEWIWDPILKNPLLQK